MATKPFSTGIFGSNDRAEVASVGNVTIERQQLRNKLEERYGTEVLEELIDEEVIQQMADKYDIAVSDQELALELNFIKAKYGSFDQQYLINNEDWEEQVRYDILLEKLLAYNVDISDEEAEATYNENEEAYKLPTAYHLSQIIVETKKEANRIYEELKKGTSFSALAMEQSIDEYSSKLKGDIGYLTKNQTRFPDSYIEQASDLHVDQWSEPFKTDGGYVILYLHDKVKGKQYSFKEVKSLIQRQLALEEINGELTASYFWDESDVQWLYEEAE